MRTIALPPRDTNTYQVTALDVDGPEQGYTLTITDSDGDTTQSVLYFDSFTPAVALTSISSDANEFTVISAVDHLLVAGDTILIADTTVSGYNTAWVVASVTDSTTFVVTDTNDFGAATGGTVTN